MNEKTLPEPESRYVKAVKIFREKLTRLRSDDLEQLASFISTKCVFIYLSTKTFDDAFRLFTIVNDRGKQLRRIDILKSVNIDPDIVKSETKRNRIAQQWEELEKELGEASFENIFHLIRLILIKEKPQGDLLKEFEDRVFRKNIVSKGEPFINLVIDFVDYYKAVFIDRDINLTDQLAVNKYKALMYIMQSEFKASEWKSCVLAFAKKFKYQMLYEFLLKLEKVYMAQWVKGMRKDERYSEYADILKRIESESDPAIVISEVKYEADTISKACLATNFYTAGHSKYFLLRLELLAAEHDVPQELTANSVEHVLPQSPKSGSDWESWNELSKVSEYVNMIGNLVLLSKARNSSAKNYDFNIKKNKYLSPRVSSYPRSIEVLSHDKWDYCTITSRTEEAARKILLDI